MKYFDRILRTGGKHSFSLTIVWVVILTALYSTLSIVRHTHFQSGGFDLGLYDQTVWQYSQFLWPYNTIKDRFILGDHLTLTLPLLAPLYWLWDDVRMLLIFQAVWISFSLLAIYQVALLRLTTTTRPRHSCQWMAFGLAVMYSLFYGIQYLVYFDFHPVVIGVGLLAWIAYFLESGKIRRLVFSIILLLLTQENMGLALSGLGIFYVFHKRHRRSAIAFILVGVGYSFIASRVISWFSPVGFQYMPQVSHNIIEIMKQFVDSQEKQHVWFYSFAWFSFLPLLSPGALLAVIFDLAQYFITGPEFSRMWSPFMHHRAILAPFLTLGTIEVLVNLRYKHWNISGIVILLVVSAFIQQYVFHFPLNKLSKREYWKNEQWMADNRSLTTLVPQSARVATQQNLVPHLSHRKEIYLVYPRPHDFDDKRCGQVSCWWLDFNRSAEYLVVDTRPGQWLTQILETNEHWLEAIGNMEKAGKIRLEKNIGSARLYSVHP